MHNGMALAANGDVYDVMQGTVSRKAGGVSLLSQVTPYDKVLYGEDLIETYYGYSVTNGVVREGMRLLVRGDELFAVSARMSDALDYILVGSEKGEYTTVLSQGSLLDLTGPIIAIPDAFQNIDIAQMTNNLNSDSCYVVVRYADGAVAGFNYMTGEMLPIETVHTYGSNYDAVSGKDIGGPGTNFEAAYEEVEALKELVTENGWLEDVAQPEEEQKVVFIPTSVPQISSAPSEGPGTTEHSDATSWIVYSELTPTPLPTPGPELNETEGTMSGSNGGTDVTVEVVPDTTTEPEEAVPEQEGEVLSGSGTSPDGNAAQNGSGATGEMGGTDNQPRKIALDKQKEDTEAYVPYYDPDAGMYLLYEQSELLAKTVPEEGQPTEKTLPMSVNEKVVRSGRMVDKYSPMANDMFDSNEDNAIGVGLLVVTLLVIAGLIVVLMVKRPDKETAE